MDTRTYDVLSDDQLRRLHRKLARQYVRQLRDGFVYTAESYRERAAEAASVLAERGLDVDAHSPAARKALRALPASSWVLGALGLILGYAAGSIF